MTKQKKPYTTYTKEFKLEAIRLMETSDRPATEIAMELGIRRNLLYEKVRTSINCDDWSHGCLHLFSLIFVAPNTR